MKRILSILIFSFFLFVECFSQITIDSVDFAPIGQNFIMAIDKFSLKDRFEFSKLSDDYWDFSKLEIDDYDTIRHLSPDKTRYGNMFDSSNYARYYRYTEIEYYNLSAERLITVGILGDYVNLGAAAIVPFQEHVLRYEFPLEYGKSFSDTAFQKFKSPYPLIDGVDSVRADISLIEEIKFDAYGTVKTPMGSFETLREKHVQKKSVKAYKYTMYGWTPAHEFDKDFVQTTYRWYAKGEEIPIVIAEVTEKGVITKIKYKYMEDMKLLIDTKHVNCRGGSNGKIDLTVKGGIPDYTYIWSNGDTIEDPKKLKAGTYSVTVTDNKGNTKTDGFSVSEPQDSLIMDITINQISCYGKYDGSLSVEAIGGIPPYFIIWTLDSVGNSISNLFEGKYGVIVRDDNRCFIWDTVEIVTPKEPLTADIEETPVKCFDGSDGMMEAFGFGGTAPYTYLWSNNDTAKVAKNLKAGEYSVTVTDNHGCTKERKKILTQPPTPIEIEFIPHIVNCKGGSDGYITTNIKGGGSPYSFYWSNGKSEKEIDKLKSGTYELTVTDDNGCIVSKTTEIEEPEDSLYIEFTKTDVDCYGERNGAINLTVHGGTPDYIYFWSIGSSDQNINNLFATLYHIEVSDKMGCIAKKEIEITQPADPLIVQSDPKNVSCYGNKDGAINLYVSGGTSPYTYKWSNGSLSEEITNLSAGQYTVKVTDAKGCVKEKTFSVESPPEVLNVEVVKNTVSCFGKNDGKIDLVVTGGVAPYKYKWSTEAETQNLDNLKPDTYVANVTDEYGCIVSKVVNITEPEELYIYSEISDVEKASDGSINLLISGGTSPYSFSWSSGETTQKIEKKTQGKYTIIVKDANGCKKTESFTIN